MICTVATTSERVVVHQARYNVSIQLGQRQLGWFRSLIVSARNAADEGYVKDMYQNILNGLRTVDEEFDDHNAVYQDTRI